MTKYIEELSCLLKYSLNLGSLNIFLALIQVKFFCFFNTPKQLVFSYHYQPIFINFNDIFEKRVISKIITYAILSQAYFILIDNELDFYRIKLQLSQSVTCFYDRKTKITEIIFQSLVCTYR